MHVTPAEVSLLNTTTHILLSTITNPYHATLYSMQLGTMQDVQMIRMYIMVSSITSSCYSLLLTTTGTHIH